MSVAVSGLGSQGTGVVVGADADDAHMCGSLPPRRIGEFVRIW